MHLNATQREIAASGAPVLWINPLTEEVAYATSTARSSGRATILAQEEGQLRVVPLTQWRLLEDGMFTRQLVELRDTTVAHLARQAAASAMRTPTRPLDRRCETRSWWRGSAITRRGWRAASGLPRWPRWGSGRRGLPAKTRSVCGSRANAGAGFFGRR